MGRPRKISVDRVIEKKAEEAVIDVLEGTSEGTSVVEENQMEQLETHPSEMRLALERIKSNNTNPDELFARIYKEITGTGKYKNIWEAEDFSTWTDDEREIRKLIIEHKWGSGNYRLEIRNPQGWVTRLPWRYIEIDSDTEKKGIPAAEIPAFKDRISEFADFAKSIRDINPASTIEKTQEMLKTTFKEGLELAKNNQNKPESVRDTISVLASLGVLKTSGSENNIIETIKTLKELGLYPDRTEEKEEKNFIEQVSEYKAAAEALGLVTGGVSGKKSTVEIITSILAPRIGEISQAVTAAFQYALAKIQANNQGGALAGNPPPGPSLPVGPPLKFPAVPEPAKKMNLETLKLIAFLEDLKNRIQTDNRDYPAILNGLQFAFGNDFIELYFAGTLGREQLCMILKKQNEYFGNTEARKFVNDFLDYADSTRKKNEQLKTRRIHKPSPENELKSGEKAYICINKDCHSEFDELDDDEVTQGCPKCGSPLKNRELVYCDACDEEFRLPAGISTCPKCKGEVENLTVWECTNCQPIWALTDGEFMKSPFCEKCGGKLMPVNESGNGEHIVPDVKIENPREKQA